MKKQVLTNVLKDEAIKRMNILHLHPNAIREFRDENKLNLSKSGILYWLDDDQEQLVRDFESKNNCIVYHVIHDYTDFGELLSLLFVDNNNEEWEMDTEDLINNTPLVYVMNLDADYCSEYGSISIKPAYGGVLRTA